MKKLSSHHYIQILRTGEKYQMKLKEITDFISFLLTEIRKNVRRKKIVYVWRSGESHFFGYTDRIYLSEDIITEELFEI